MNIFDLDFDLKIEIKKYDFCKVLNCIDKNKASVDATGSGSSHFLKIMINNDTIGKIKTKLYTLKYRSL